MFIGTLNTTNMSNLTLLIKRPNKIPAGYFVEINRLFQKCIWKFKDLEKNF